jgi:hypothetical protein
MGTTMKHSNASANLSFRTGIPDPYALRLGHVTSRWGAIAFALEGIIWDLAGLQPGVGHVLTRSLEAGRKRELIQSLLEVVVVSPEVRRCWARADDQIALLAPTADVLAHGRWMPDPGSHHAHEQLIGWPAVSGEAETAVAGTIACTLQDLDRRTAEADDLLSMLAELAGRLRDRVEEDR